MPSNDPSEIKKFEHEIMNAISGQVTVYGTPVTEDDSRFIQKTEPTKTNVTTHHNVAPRFFSPPARPPVQLQPVESSTNNNENVTAHSPRHPERSEGSPGVAQCQIRRSLAALGTTWGVSSYKSFYKSFDSQLFELSTDILRPVFGIIWRKLCLLPMLI